MIYKRVIAAQPKALTHTIATLGDQLSGFDPQPLRNRPIGVAGIGASHEAAVVISGEMRRRGLPASAMRCSDLLAQGTDQGAYVLISVSGRSMEPLTILRNNPGNHFVSLTKTADNPMTRAVGAALSYDSGEDSTPSASGYTGSLIAGGMLTDTLDGNRETDWARLPADIQSVLDTVNARADDLAAFFANRHAIDCVGAVSAYGTACEAALLLREAVRLPAWGFDTLHYLHGPMEAMDARTGIVLHGAGREVKIATDMAATGCPVLLITTADVAEAQNLRVIRIPEWTNQIAQGVLDILPMQVLSARMSDLAGLTDVKFRYRQTDTKAPLPEDSTLKSA